jgi:hypothetical protein
LEVLPETLVKNGIHIILLVMQIETESWMVIDCENLKITLPFRTRLASVCVNCRKVLYYTEKIDSVTLKVFNQASNGHKYASYPDHTIIGITRKGDSKEVFMKVVKEPALEIEYLTEEDNV